MKGRRADDNWLPVDKTASSVIKLACETMELRLVAEEHKRAERAVIGQAKYWQCDVQHAACTQAASHGSVTRAAGGRAAPAQGVHSLAGAEWC